MAKSNWGITSGFIGKLGNVVGYNWKGKNIQRALVKGADSRSEKQLYSRTKFGQLGKLSSLLYDAIYEGYRREASEKKSTQSGLFIKYNQTTITGSNRDSLRINYEILKLSSDKIQGVTCFDPTLEGNKLTVGFQNNAPLNHRCTLTDRVYICVFAADMNAAICQCVGTRADDEGELTIPINCMGTQMHVYCFVIGASSTNDGMASATQYVGKVSCAD